MNSASASQGGQSSQRWRIAVLQCAIGLLVLLISLPVVAAGKIYTCETDGGDPIYQDTPCKDRESELVDLDGRDDPRRIRYRVQLNTDQYYPADAEGDEVTQDLGPDPVDVQLAALRESKRSCGSRHMGRSREQLVKFQDMMQDFDDPERRDRELEEIGCHLDYLDQMDEVRQQANLEPDSP